MADSHSLQISPPAQEVESPPAEAKIISLGTRHNLSDFVAYLTTASLGRLEGFELNQCHEIAELRRQICESLERIADAVAIRRFLQMQAEATRQKNHETTAARDEFKPQGISPDDVTPFDPFFRSQDEAVAILAASGSARRHQWPDHFATYGCLRCGRPESEAPYGSGGFCRRCYTVLRGRLKRIDAALILPRLGEKVPQGTRWELHFAKFGCHVCTVRENHSACGFCKRCGGLVIRRLEDIERKLKEDRAPGR